MTNARPDPEISVVICTYNGAGRLLSVFEHLAAQQCPEGLSWDVLVVDNASSDRTREIVESFAQTGLVPALRYVYEAKPGLTAARLRGVRETESPWVAYVDDDNLLQADWIAAIGRAIRNHPDAGGIGGQVVLDWEAPPPAYLRPFGFCFAEQKVGGTDSRADSLAGAGMVLRRDALLASGWVRQPLLGDRTGRKLVSGGDVEIAQRVRAAGYSLYLAPEARLLHRISADRMERRYLFRVNFELGISSVVIGVLTWPGDWNSWCKQARAARADWFRRASVGLAYALRNRSGVTEAVAWASFAFGYSRGMARCERLLRPEQERLLGAGDASACHPYAVKEKS